MSKNRCTRGANPPGSALRSRIGQRSPQVRPILAHALTGINIRTALGWWKPADEDYSAALRMAQSHSMQDAVAIFVGWAISFDRVPRIRFWGAPADEPPPRLAEAEQEPHRYLLRGREALAQRTPPIDWTLIPSVNEENTVREADRGVSVERSRRTLDINGKNGEPSSERVAVRMLAKWGTIFPKEVCSVTPDTADQLIADGMAEPARPRTPPALDEWLQYWTEPDWDIYAECESASLLHAVLLACNVEPRTKANRHWAHWGGWRDGDEFGPDMMRVPSPPAFDKLMERAAVTYTTNKGPPKERMLAASVSPPDRDCWGTIEHLDIDLREFAATVESRDWAKLPPRFPRSRAAPPSGMTSNVVHPMTDQERRNQLLVIATLLEMEHIKPNERGLPGRIQKKLDMLAGFSSQEHPRDDTTQLPSDDTIRRIVEKARAALRAVSSEEP